MELIDDINKGFCEIRVKGKLEPRWIEWFDLTNVAYEADVTLISGLVADQSALLGLVEKISMLGMTIVSIRFSNAQN